MRVLDIITESKKSKSDQLDELSLSQVGKGVGKVARGAAKATGALAGGIVGAGKAFMKGFRGAKAFVGGDNEPADDTSKTGKSTDQDQTTAQTTAPAGQPAPATPASTATPAVPSSPTAGATKASAGAAKQGTAGQKTDMKTIKTSIQALPKNQRASLRKIIAAKAGVA